MVLPPFEVREPVVSREPDPKIAYVYVKAPREEIAAFRDWMKRHGVKRLKTAVRFALWYIVAHDVSPPDGGRGAA
jgi:hypothetical protein